MSSKRVAIVLADDFEDSEFTEPCARLTDNEVDIDIIGTDPRTVTGKNGTEVAVSLAAADADPEAYTGLLIPGGFSPDHLRIDSEVVAFTAEMMNRGVPVAAVCHGPSLLIEADAVQGRTLTSWPSIRTDLANAGATVVDEEVHVDGNLITSRQPADLDAFTTAFLSAIGAGPLDP